MGDGLKLVRAEASIGEASGYFQTHGIVIRSSGALERFEDRSGFVVANANVRSVAGTEGSKVKHSGPNMLRVDVPARQGASVLIQFEDGSGTVVAGLDGFVGTIVVDRGGVVSVNYTPSKKGGRWGGDESDQRRLDQLRANAAAATRSGSFRVETPEQATQLADAIRAYKSVDPTLGMYAAYAYEQAGQLSSIQSVAKLMLEELGVSLFDVAMLAYRDLAVASGRVSVAPFCPMLSKGWNYVGVSGATMPEPILNAGKQLREALWTTFESNAIDLLLGSGLFPIRPLSAG